MNRATELISRPNFIVDKDNVPLDYGRQVDWTLVTEAYRAGGKFVQLAAAALVAATSITTDPLEAPVTPGMSLYFGQAGEFARVSAYAAKGATSVPVDALPSALEDNDRAYIPGTGGTLRIPSGTVMVVVAANQKMVPRAIRPGAETAYGLLYGNAEQDNPNYALTGYGLILGGVVWENLLPDATGGPPATLPADYVTELGNNFRYRAFTDNTPVS